jgi:translation initiation factor 2 subunit 2
MAEEEYLSLLEKAKDELPDTIEKHERFSVPEVDVFQEGKQTVIRNFGDIVDALRRDPEHLLHFLLRELGAPGSVEGRRAIIKAKISPSQVTDRIGNYTETWVLCSECGRPDTHIVKDGRVLVLECEACGAHRPVHVSKTIRPQEVKELQEGETYELVIEDVGKRGDGLARKGNMIIYVPGTVKGSRVKVFVEKVDGKIAFGRIAGE